MSNTTQKKFSVVHHDNTAKSKELIAKFIRKEKNPHFETPIGDKIADLLMLFHKPKSTLELLDATFAQAAFETNVDLKIDTYSSAYIDGAASIPDLPAPLPPNVFSVSSPASDMDLDNHLRILFRVTPPVRSAATAADLRRDAGLLIKEGMFGDFVRRVCLPIGDLATLDNLFVKHGELNTGLASLPEFSSGISKEYLPKARTWLDEARLEWQGDDEDNGDWHYIEKIMQRFTTSNLVTLSNPIPVERGVLVLSQYIRACFLNVNNVTATTYMDNAIDITGELLSYHFDRDLIESYFKHTEPTERYLTVKGILDLKLLSRYCVEHYAKILGDLAVLTNDLAGLTGTELATQQEKVAAKKTEIAQFKAIACVGAIRSLINDDSNVFVKIFTNYASTATLTVSQRIVENIVATVNGTAVEYSDADPLLENTDLTSGSFEKFVHGFTWKIKESGILLFGLEQARVLLFYVLIKVRKYLKGDSYIKSLTLIYDFVRLAFQLEEGVFLKTLDESSADMERIIFEMLAGSPVANLFRAFMSNIQFSGIDYTKFNFIPIASGGEIEAEKDVKLSVLLKGSVTVKNTSKKDIRVEILSFEHGVLAREQDKPVIVHAGEKKLVRSD